MSKPLSNEGQYHELLIELKQQIRAAQARATLAVNTSLIQLYWNIGKMIAENQALFEGRSNYVNQLAKDLQSEFPGTKGFSRSNLFSVRKFYQFYAVQQLVGRKELPAGVDSVQQAVAAGQNAGNADSVQQPAGLNQENVWPVLTGVPWGHHVLILNKVKEVPEAIFYLQQTIAHNWSRAILALQIEQNLFARQGKAVTNFKTTLPGQQALLAGQMLKDPYNFGFLTLEAKVQELEIEKQLTEHITKFLLELGKGFAFIGRQYPLEVGEKGYRLDLLFYHIRLRCFVVIDLKTGELRVIEALKQAGHHNSNLMVRPEVILWPDSDSQWAGIIPVLQANLPQLLLYGSFEPAKKQGPAIWLKCMVARMLPEADWPADAVPIIYLPGVSRSDLRNVENAVFNFQPLIEYQYTGNLFLQKNGREWSILAFVENPINGLGIRVAKDQVTKYALKKTLPSIFQDGGVLFGKTIIDADYLHNHLFPDIIPAILEWMGKGEAYLQKLDVGKKEVFANLCKSQYHFEPGHKNIKAIAEKLGSQRNAWKYVWQFYATAPHKYPQIEDLLRLAKPDDLGTGMFRMPEESWPQVNEQHEIALGQALMAAAKADAPKALALLKELEANTSNRRSWVWCELGKAPLACTLQHLVQMASKARESFPSSSIEALKTYYTTSGYSIDQCMRKSLAAVKTEKDKANVKSIIQLFYRPWLETLIRKFQKLIETDASIFTSQTAVVESESYVLFVDAFRYELAEEFSKRIPKNKYKVSLRTAWSAIPSLTPTAKPNVSPVAPLVSTESGITEFRPQLPNGKDMTTPVFRDSLKNNGFTYVSGAAGIAAENNYWQEIGDIDAKGHEEQGDIVKRVAELFDQVQEALEVAFEKGIKRIKIVTDHGWLLLPGGLPKAQLNAGLTETRWGRCALIKEGAQTDLLHLPWRWNPSIFIAYAPGISFFKANQEYAHGGISIHECLVPVLEIEHTNTVVVAGNIAAVKWINLKCAIQTNHVPHGFSVDIRTKFNDPTTSIVLSKSKTIKDNAISLMVDDAAEAQAATIVLLDESGRILDKKPTTVGG